MRARRQIENLLVASVQKPDACAEAMALGDAVDAVPGAASFHGVAGFVLEATKGRGVFPEPVVRALRDEVLRSNLLKAQVSADLDHVVSVLDSADLPFLVMKGPVLDQVVHQRRGLRSYNDLDLLVSPTDLAQAVHVLEQEGSELLDQNWELLLSQLPGELHLVAPSGTVVDLHWNILNSRQLRTTFDVDTEELLADRMRSDIGCRSVPRG